MPSTVLPGYQRPEPPRVRKEAHRYYVDYQRAHAWGWYAFDGGDSDKSFAAACAMLWRREIYAEQQLVDTFGASRSIESETPNITDQSICERLWTKYNMDDRPDRRTQRSLSVGDVVRIVDDAELSSGKPIAIAGRLYLCRNVGWEPFVTERRIETIVRRDRSLPS